MTPMSCRKDCIVLYGQPIHDLVFTQASHDTFNPHVDPSNQTAICADICSRDAFLAGLKVYEWLLGLVLLIEPYSIIVWRRVFTIYGMCLSRRHRFQLVNAMCKHSTNLDIYEACDLDVCDILAAIVSR